MAYELLVKGGQVIDPAQGLEAPLDVAIDQGRIAALTPDIPCSMAHRVLDARGMLVTPGLIDIHTHVAEAIISLAVAPDQAGVLSGVTTVCDAGSTGYANFGGLRKWVIPQARTDVFCFLHVAPVGEAILPEIGWQQVNPEKMLETIQANRDVVKGLKIRATVNLMENLGIDGIKAAKSVAVEAGLPLVVHIGIDTGETISEDGSNAFTGEILSQLGKGDVLTHAFTKRQGGVIRPDGRVMPGLREALERGVVLDVGSCLGQVDIQVARKGMEQGFLPTTLSTDFTTYLLGAPVPVSLAVLMSEFLALGLSLRQVVEMVTINPARVLGEEQRRGSLRVGMPADLSLFVLAEGDFVFVDAREGNVVRGERLLVPNQALKHGVVVATAPRSREYAQWSADARRMMARAAQG